MKILRILLLSAVFGVLLIQAGQVQSDTSRAYDLIAAVNDLRVNSGLSSISTDSALMSAAQTQADYLASTYDTTYPSWDEGHVGAGGTYARDRAVAAGYTLTSGMNVVENWAGGNSSTTLSEVIYEFWGDETHMGTMLNRDAVAMGAGVSQSAGGAIYFILNVGVRYGSGGSGASVSSTIPTTAVTAQVALVQVATPRADGTIVHIVGSGQALWNIAAAYDVSVDQLKDLNKLNSDIITTGQEILVQVAPTATDTPPATETPRPPTRTPIPAQTAQAVETQTQENGEDDKAVLGMDRQTMGLALILICVAGLALVVLGTISKDKNKKKTPKQE